MDSQAWPLIISSGRAFFYDGEAPSPEESLDRFWIWHFKKHENGQIREDGRLCRNYGELAEGVFQGEMRVRLVKRTAIFVKSGPIASASPCPSCRFFVSVAALEGNIKWSENCGYYLFALSSDLVKSSSLRLEDFAFWVERFVSQ